MLVSQREAAKSCLAMTRVHRGGVLATKVRYFGVKSTKVCRDTFVNLTFQIKPAKVGHLQSLGVNSAKVRRFCATKTPPPGLRSVGGPKLLKWGLSRRGSNLLKSDQPLTSTIYPPVRLWLTFKAAFSFIRFAVSALGSQRI